MTSRLLFLCASGSGRAQLAASLLQPVAGNRFEIWSTPTQKEEQLASYRRIREPLSTCLALEFRFPSRMLTIVAPHK